MPEIREKNLKTIKVTSTLEEGFKVVTKARKHVIVQDLPEFAGGKDSGPLPPELLLASLAGCIGIVARYHSGKFGIEIKGMEIEVEGDYDPRGFAGQDVKPGFQEIRVKVVVDAPSASEEDLRRLMEFVEKHCPIEDTLVDTTKVVINVKKKT